MLDLTEDPALGSVGVFTLSNCPVKHGKRQGWIHSSCSGISTRRIRKARVV